MDNIHTRGNHARESTSPRVVAWPRWVRTERLANLEFIEPWIDDLAGKRRQICSTVDRDASNPQLPLR
jgi:hypothetical protein